jgi:hypothetical protein
VKGRAIILGTARVRRTLTHKTFIKVQSDRVAGELAYLYSLFVSGHSGRERNSKVAIMLGSVLMTKAKKK